MYYMHLYPVTHCIALRCIASHYIHACDEDVDGTSTKMRVCGEWCECSSEKM
jgi:hypothetical protein